MAKKKIQKKPPERQSPRGAKDTNLFRERLVRSTLADAPAVSDPNDSLARIDSLMYRSGTLASMPAEAASRSAVTSAAKPMHQMQTPRGRFYFV